MTDMMTEDKIPATLDSTLSLLKKTESVFKFWIVSYLLQLIQTSLKQYQCSATEQIGKNMGVMYNTSSFEKKHQQTTQQTSHLYIRMTVLTM